MQAPPALCETKRNEYELPAVKPARRPIRCVRPDKIDPMNNLLHNTGPLVKNCRLPPDVFPEATRRRTIPAFCRLRPAKPKNDRLPLFFSPSFLPETRKENHTNT